MKDTEDLRGQEFGRLRVLRRAESIPEGKTTVFNRTAWECKCECGNIVVKKARDLKRAYYNECKICQVERKKLYGHPHGAARRIFP